METGNCISEEEVCKIASFISECELTERIFEVSLWNNKDEFGLPVVIIGTEAESLTMAVQDLRHLSSSIISLLKLIDK